MKRATAAAVLLAAIGGCGPPEVPDGFNESLQLSCGAAPETVPGSSHYLLQVRLAQGALSSYPLRISWGDSGADVDETRSVEPGVTHVFAHDYPRTGDFAVRMAAVNFANVQFFCGTTHEVRALAPAGCSVFLDDFERDDRWRTTVTATDGRFLQTAAVLPTGGNPGRYRRMTHVLPGAGEITVVHHYAVEYDPRSAGALSRIRYSEDRIQIDPPAPGTAIAGGFWLEQGRREWLVPLGTGDFRSTRWESAALELTAADLPGADFSAQGAPLRLGFYRANSTGGAPFTLTHGIDNWRVEVCR